MPTADQPDPPIIAFLRQLIDDPLGTLGEIINRTAGLAATAEGRCVMVLAAAAAAVLLARWMFRRVWWRRQRARGRLLLIRPPATVDPAGAVLLWRNLTGLLSPAWKRWLCGQAPIALEYHFDIHGTRIALWVPGSVPPGQVERAVTAAWPGARVSAESDDWAPHSVAEGGQLVPLRPEWWPLHTRQDTDPLRPLLEAASALAEGESARVQILARPATGRRLRVLHAAVAGNHVRARGPLNGTLRAVTTVVSEIVTLLLPGGFARSRPDNRASRTVAHTGEERRPIREKAVQPQWETRIHYVVTSKASGAATRHRLHGLAHEIASAFAVHTGHNGLRRRRLVRPVARLTVRRLRHGFLLSVAELAALAHLPYDEDTPGVERAGARAVAPSPRIPR